MGTEVGPSGASSSRLLVLQVTENEDAKVLRTHDLSSRKELSIALCDDWREANVATGHIARVILTHPDGTYQPWCSAQLQSDAPLLVTQESNFFIHHPDTLIAGTSIAESFHCLRKAVINARTPSGSAASSAAGSEAALFGHMIHEMFQIILAKDSNTRAYASPGDTSNVSGVDTESFFEAAEDVLYRHYESLYAASVSDKHARLVLHKVIPDIMEWYMSFMGSGNCMNTMGVDVTDGKNSRNVVVTEVNDIEELIWSPVLGLKGKVDASVKLRVDAVDVGVGVFELKTGCSKGFSAVSHAAQVTLYNLLMSDRNNRYVNQGLLSYIRYQDALKSVRADEGKGDYDRERVDLLQTRVTLDEGQKNKSIVGTRGDLVALLMQRNRLASHLRRESAIEDLPPLIKGRPESCRKCFSNDSCMVQHRLLERGSSATVADGPGSDLFHEKTAHLTDAHAKYYRFWRDILSDEEELAGRGAKGIWASRSAHREAHGKCLGNLMLKPNHAFQQASLHDLLAPGERLEAVFVRHPKSDLHRDLVDIGITRGDYVIISAERVLTRNEQLAKVSDATETWQCGLANGFVKSIAANSVTVEVERSLVAWTLHQRLELSEVYWRVDAEEMYARHYTAKKTLENLFSSDDAAGTGHLRELVVDGAPPRFRAVINEEKSAEEITKKHEFHVALNSDQEQALQMSLRAMDYALILGMPGTGKTTTLAAVVHATAARGKTVLLCSHTNSAVDNLLRKLLDIGFTSIIRLGRNLDVIDSQVHSYHISKVCVPGKTTTQLERELDAPRVVATTCLGINHPLLARRTQFDLVVVDEASQIVQPVCIGPLQFTKGAFILVGDHYQLPPLQMSGAGGKKPSRAVDQSNRVPNRMMTEDWVSSDHVDQNESLFRRLCVLHPEAMVSLSKQYRMAAEIMQLSNELVYSGSLSCGSDKVASQRLHISTKGLRTLSEWLRAVRNPSRRLVFLETEEGPKNATAPRAAKKVRTGESCGRESEEEASIVVACVRALVEAGLKTEDITVLSPFRAQVHLLRWHLESAQVERGLNVQGTEVSTVDQYQGKDNKCIIVSFARSGLKTVGPLLKDWRRINVALTRAREKLILVGSGRTLARGGHFLSSLMNYLESRKLIYPVA